MGKERGAEGQGSWAQGTSQGREQRVHETGHPPLRPHRHRALHPPHSPDTKTPPPPKTNIRSPHACVCMCVRACVIFFI